MKKLWGGRFKQKGDVLTPSPYQKQVDQFNASIPFDQRLYPYDIQASMAHARMLGDQGIIPAVEATQLVEALQAIRAEMDQGLLVVDTSAEDIHAWIEDLLTQRLGEPGKKIHTGRSRNDQVATDFKLYLRDAIGQIEANLSDLQAILTEQAEQHQKTVMPGYTHMQPAQPITLGYHLSAYREMFSRDQGRLRDAAFRMNTCPLGSGALAGSTFPLNRVQVADELGFHSVAWNALDAVSDRDFCIEALSAFSLIMMHMSRFCEEIILWNTVEFAFIELDDAFTTGSSIMPQKKNPDVAELIRGKTGRVYGHLMGLLSLMKSLPLAYNKDLQEDKEALFDAVDTVRVCVQLMAGMLKTARFNTARMAQAAKGGFINATDIADYLVRKGMAFRQAHEVVGQLVCLCLEKDCALEELSLPDYQSVCGEIDESVYDSITLEACLKNRQIG